VQRAHAPPARRKALCHLAANSAGGAENKCGPIDRHGYLLSVRADDVKVAASGIKRNCRNSWRCYTEIYEPA
jgi:hypothetical protein